MLNTYYTCYTCVYTRYGDKDSANRAEYKIFFFIFIPEVQPIFEISVSNLQKIEKSGAKIVEKIALRPEKIGVVCLKTTTKELKESKINGYWLSVMGY